MEHVEVLRHMKETIRAIMPSEVAALDAAIASLSAPQPPAEAQPVGVEGFRDWVIEQMPAGTVIDNPELWAERLARAYELNVPTPSLPVGVRYDAGLLSDYGGGNVGWWHDYIRSELDRAHDFYTEALAQQPAAHPAITHCDNCGCDWLDNGLNPIGCPYCKQNAWRAAFVEERATRYREGGMKIEQARIHAETDATLMEQIARQQQGGSDDA